MSFAPGQRLEARCTRCRDVTGHVIVALVDNQIVKVECLACGSVHKYYPAEKTPKRAALGPIRVESGRERASAVKQSSRPSVAAPKAKAPSKAEQQRAKVRAELERQWQYASARSAGQSLSYSMQGKFSVGDKIEHAHFGVGFVLSVTSPDKMDILFQEGIKTLRCVC